MPSEEYSYTPKYRQIQSFIIEKISCGDLSIGDRIPSETELMAQFEVSRVTANAAIKELSSMGIIKRVRGVGSFVSENADSIDKSDSMCFTGNIKVHSREKNLGHKNHQCLSIREIVPDSGIRFLLKLKPGQKAYEIVRQIKTNDVIEELDYSYVPVNLLKDHKPVPEEVESCYFHEFLREAIPVKPKFIKFFIRKNQDFETCPELVNFDFSDDSCLIFDLIVYNSRKVPLGLTRSFSKKALSTAFITLEL